MDSLWELVRVGEPTRLGRQRETSKTEINEDEELSPFFPVYTALGHKLRFF